MKKIFTAVVLGAVFMSWNAAALDVVSKSIHDSSYDYTWVQASLGAEAPIIVKGAPGADPQAVADALRLPGWFQPKPFKAIPAANAPEKRFVLVFSPGRADDGSSLCSGAAQSRGALEPEIALAAWCDGDSAMAEARLSSDSLSDPRSDDFAVAMRRLFKGVLPRRNPEEDRNEPECLTFC